MPLLSFAAFNHLSARTQLTFVLMEGKYLAKRFDETGSRLSLYYLGSFFVEVYYDAVLYHEHCCRSFVSTRQLATYDEWVQLPNL
ncbi:hypothetical protein [Hymenobacter sp. YC55]|uniref:hypothetical protein n=1 Tax=Hymenobacter sp. YC55 TaxID=3034019 RepID=UPI0023F99FD3|nr:hypothetical protein [Hymenobacter sp. YC55]MDF7815377.1 hypothetical protein [Hymenobacter sp. YC55]